MKAKRESIERQKEIYIAASTIKESEMKSRNFSLLFVSLCISSAAGLIAFGEGIESINFVWSVIGVFFGAAAVELGHAFRKRKEMKESGKEVQI